MDHLERDSVTLDDRQLADDESGLDDDNEIRLYYTPDLSFVAPSVTSITSRRVDQERDDAIGGWKDRYDGSSSYCKPHWKRQLKFKGWRGTLIHYTCLSTLGSTSSGNESYYTRVGDTDRGIEEYKAERGLKQMDEYDGADAWNKSCRDSYWAKQEFEDLCAERGIDEETIVAIEEYVCEETFQFAGQADMVYEDEEGELVVVDIKTGSAVRMDNKVQIAAYAYALPYDIDRAEIWRLYPDDSDVEIQSSTEWDRSLPSLYEQFLGVLYRTLDELPAEEELKTILDDVTVHAAADSASATAD